MGTKPCPTCNGSKIVMEKRGNRWVKITCYFCGGTGIDPR